MPAPSLSQRKVVVVHRGARDAYQVSAGLAGAGLLEALVTDLYWSGDRPWARRLAALLPARVRRLLAARHQARVPGRLVTTRAVSGFWSYLLEHLPGVPFALRRRAIRHTDAALGRAAGERARRSGALLLSYSYYAYHAFRGRPGLGILFQLHPHPASVRRILEQELRDHPDCAASLGKEWELALPEEDFARLVEEPKLASDFLVASSFTRQTLIENGIAPERIAVVPYGVDTARFRPASGPGRPGTGPLKLLFVGTINQRKGIKYLLEAVRLTGARQVELTVCGRVVDDLGLFRRSGAEIRVRPSVSFAELLASYQQSDLFVLPSVAEGFGQVLLEALACGLPILSTTHTAAPDLITPGVEGWAVAPRRPELLASHIEWALGHRSELEDMKRAARRRAEQFTWARFEAGVVQAVERVLAREAGGGGAGQAQACEREAAAPYV